MEEAERVPLSGKVLYGEEVFHFAGVFLLIHSGSYLDQGLGHLCRLVRLKSVVEHVLTVIVLLLQKTLERLTFS